MSQHFRVRTQTVRPRKPCANPIFESWIMEWKEDAEEKNSKMKFVYAKALQSLRKYPLSLPSGKHCSILENFGSHMCKMIENRMVKENMIPTDDLQGVVDLEDEAPSTSKTSRRVKASKVATGKEQTKKSKVTEVVLSDDEMEEATVIEKEKPKKKQGKQYIPAFRSGAYALLIALYKRENEPDYRGYMTKGELLHEAQKYCDSSLTKPDTAKNSHYTAWTSMKGLVSKELIFKRGNPSQFFLTPDGRALAQKLVSAETGGAVASMQQNNEDMASDYGASSQDEDIEHAFVANDFRMEPGTFEVVLYVDTCETNGYEV